MKSTVLWGLVALNVLLVVAVVMKYTPENRAHAQAGRPSDYLMAPGSVAGGNTGVVFVVDMGKRELSALTYNDAMKRLDTMPKISLDRIFDGAGGVGQGGGNNPPKRK